MRLKHILSLNCAFQMVTIFTVSLLYGITREDYAHLFVDVFNPEVISAARIVVIALLILCITLIAFSIKVAINPKRLRRTLIITTNITALVSGSLLVIYYFLYGPYFTKMEDVISLHMNDYGAHNQSVDSMHRKYKCCGAMNHLNFATIPDSCCELIPCTPENVNRQGCIPVIVEKYSWICKFSIVMATLYIATQISTSLAISSIVPIN